jgi:hypothetical protein
MPPKKKSAKNIDLMLKIASSELSDNSKENYRMRAQTLEKRSGKPLIYVATNPDTYIAEIQSWYSNNTSRKAYMSFILSLFRYNPDFLCDNRKIYEKWAEVFNDTHKQVIDRYETNKPTQRQVEGFVSYTEIVKKRDELEKGSIERLLLGFYTYLKPMRCDYGMVKIYKDRLPTEKEREKNYVFIADENKAILHLGEYKTSKTYGDHEIELPKPLYEDLLLSLKKNDREWLFVDSNGTKQSRNTYCSWTLRVFKKIFNKPLSVSLIRHSFINQLNMTDLSIKEKKDIAQQMGHNIQTQDIYRLIFNDKKENDE